MYIASYHSQRPQDQPAFGAETLATALSEPIRTASSLLPIASIRPTQFTVGFREVAEKRRRLRTTLGIRVVGRRVVPVVLGPDLNYYALDRHHWLSALAAEGFKDAPTSVVADFRGSSSSSFWADMDRRGWCRPFDAEGRRQDYSDIPSSMAELSDDPFRSLASALRRKGGFSKDRKLYSEFASADYLRRLIPLEELNDSFEAALDTALLLSRGMASRKYFDGNDLHGAHHENERS